jgi:aminotransferase
MKERTVLLGGFSKGFAMTGWRLGYAAAPAPVIDAMTSIHSYTMMCCPTPSQYAALESLRNGQREVPRMRDEYNQRRRIVLKRLTSMGLELVEPRGAFYAFPSIARIGLSSTEFAERLLREEKVAVIPGVSFGKSGEGHVRCCYAASLEQIEEAMRRIGRFLEKIM